MTQSHPELAIGLQCCTRKLAIGWGRNLAGHEGYRTEYEAQICHCNEGWWSSSTEKVTVIMDDSDLLAIVTCHRLGTQQKYSKIFFCVFTNLCKGL